MVGPSPFQDGRTSFGGAGADVGDRPPLPQPMAGGPSMTYFHRPPPPPRLSGGGGIAGPSTSNGSDPRYHGGGGMPAPSQQHPSEEFASPVHRGMSVRPSPPPFRYSSDGGGGGGGGGSGNGPSMSSYDFNYQRSFVPPQGDSQWAAYEARRSHHADSVSSNATNSSGVSMYASSSAPAPIHGHPSSHAQSDVNRGSADSYGRPAYGRHASDGDLVDGVHPSASNAAASTAVDRKVSCLECRASKVKCSGKADGGCDRCKRIKRPCVFEQHRRGRKPAQVKMHKLEQSVDTIISALSALTEYKRNKATENEDVNDDDGDENDDEDDRRFLKKRAQKRRAESDTSVNADVHRSVKARAGSSSQHGDSLTSPEDDLHVLGKGKSPDTGRLSTFLETIADQARQLRSPSSPQNHSSAHSREQAQSDAGNVLVADLDVAAQELGQPPMSNPLKLLAQASDSTMESSNTDTIANTPMRHDWEEGHGDEDGKDVEVATNHVKDGRRDKGKKGREEGEKGRKDKQRGASRRGYWSIGMYSTRPDRGPDLDPVTKGIMSASVARDLYQLYMSHLNAPITLLDPSLHSFAYVRSHSALLLSASCALAARFASHIDNAEEIANRLDAHVQEVVLPAVLLKGFRSAEIAQAFIILAAYHCNTQSLDGDRSWSYVGYGIRIAAELDMNARLLSEWSGMGKVEQTPNTNQPDTPASSKAGGVASSVGGHSDDGTTMSSDEAAQRRLRNRERTWCNLWLFEYSLSTHMGRRSTLGQDPVILGVSAGWHRVPYAIKGDEAIVALIGLRRIQIKNAEFFEHSILSNTLSAPARRQTDSAALRFQLDFYDKSCRADINSWTSMYVDERDEGGHSYRMKNASLYASYARLILNSYALKCTTDVQLLEPFYQESYSAAMTYLTLYSERIRSPGLTYVHNSSVVTVAYVAVFALKLCSLDPNRYPYIDSHRVFSHVRELVHALTKAGSVTPWRNGAASSYAPYLAAVLERVEHNTHMESERRRSSASQDARLTAEDGSASHLSTTTGQQGVDGHESHVRPSSASAPNTANSSTSSEFSGGAGHAGLFNAPLTGAVAQPSIAGQTPSRFPAFSFASSTHPAAVSASKFQPEALTFMAGPSGVEAATILDDLAVHEEYLRFGVPPYSQQDNQFSEGSLFGDMSVFLNASFNEHANPWPATMNMGQSANAGVTSNGNTAA